MIEQYEKGEGRNEKIKKLSFDEVNGGYVLTSQHYGISSKCPVTVWEPVPYSIVDSGAYTNIQLKPKTDPNQVCVYLKDQIQQSPSKHIGKHVVKK